MPSRDGTRMILLEARLSWSMFTRQLMLSGSRNMALLNKFKSVSEVSLPNHSGRAGPSLFLKAHSVSRWLRSESCSGKSCRRGSVSRGAMLEKRGLVVQKTKTGWWFSKTLLQR